MHSRIFQITTEQVERENYLNEDTLEQGDTASIDYCAEIDRKDREESIAYLVDSILPEDMFTRLGANILRYNGGMEQWKAETVAKIKEKAAALTADNYLRFGELYTLKKAVENPLDTAYLFYTDKEGVAKLGRPVLRLYVLCERTRSGNDALYRRRYRLSFLEAV